MTLNFKKFIFRYALYNASHKMSGFIYKSENNMSHSKRDWTGYVHEK